MTLSGKYSDGFIGRSPYGERGLKFESHDMFALFDGSLSLRRAWIEMAFNASMEEYEPVALLTESVD